MLLSQITIDSAVEFKDKNTHCEIIFGFICTALQVDKDVNSIESKSEYIGRISGV